ncbi:MAG: hypothetical protein HRT89_11625, partial [Lentisphaeria bacterium]|nr:hypothetical protein [Lentisphaeria bacterium]NQZ68705.1 hypothetical protein [Lentisphaeria bacterium]
MKNIIKDSKDKKRKLANWHKRWCKAYELLKDGDAQAVNDFYEEFLNNSKRAGDYELIIEGSSASIVDQKKMKILTKEKCDTCEKWYRNLYVSYGLCLNCKL